MKKSDSYNRLFASFLVFWLGVCQAPGAETEDPLFQVSPVPLTTEAQRRQNIPGGEGFQLVMTIAYAPSNPQTVYLGSDTSQVWKSLDGGKSWRPVNGGYKSVGSRSLFVHPRNEDLVFSAGSHGTA